MSSQGFASAFVFDEASESPIGRPKRKQSTPLPSDSEEDDGPQKISRTGNQEKSNEEDGSDSCPEDEDDKTKICDNVPPKTMSIRMVKNRRFGADYEGTWQATKPHFWSKERAYCIGDPKDPSHLRFRRYRKASGHHTIYMRKQKQNSENYDWFAWPADGIDQQIEVLTMLKDEIRAYAEPKRKTPTRKG